MANIFSGIFSSGGGGNSAQEDAYYRSQLSQWEDAKKAEELKQSILENDVRYKAAKEGMSPERQNLMDYARGMAMSPGTSDKGLEMLSKGVGQRGGTIADILSEVENRKTHKAKWDYELANPKPGDVPSKVAVAERFQEWAKDDVAKKGEDSKYYGMDDAQLAELAWRNEQYLEGTDSYYSTLTGDETSKNLLRGGIKKELVVPYTNRLNNFQSNVDDSEDLLNFTQNRIDDIRQLYDQTDGWTTGLVGLGLQTINPSSEAADWERLKETIVSNIGLDKIMQLKAGSAQGATGLGALNEKELAMLQNHAGNLHAAQTPEEIKRVLRRLERDLKRSQDRIMRELPKELAFRNNYGQYLPFGGDAKYTPSEHQSKLFSGGQYERVEVPGLQLQEEQEQQEPFDPNKAVNSAAEYLNSTQ